MGFWCSEDWKAPRRGKSRRDRHDGACRTVNVSHCAIDFDHVERVFDLKVFNLYVR